jgi:hypothetical protein
MMKTTPPYPDGLPFRYSGFTCPQCGGHFFGTFLNRMIPQRGIGVDDPVIGARMIRPEFPGNVDIGSCNYGVLDDGGSTCNYKWERSKDDELGVMYSVPEEEWSAYCTEIERRRKEKIPY